MTSELDDYPQLMLVGEVAKILRVSTKTVWRYRNENGLPTCKFGGAVRFDKTQFKAWLDEKKEGDWSASDE